MLYEKQNIHYFANRFLLFFLAIWNLKDVDVEALGDEEFVTANLQGGRASNQRRVDREFNEE